MIFKLALCVACTWVIDGDSIIVGGIEYRLHSIDAPEIRQTCKMRDSRRYLAGITAAQYLRALVKGRQVRCR